MCEAQALRDQDWMVGYLLLIEKAQKLQLDCRSEPLLPQQELKDPQPQL